MAILVSWTTETLLRRALTQFRITAGSQQPVTNSTQNKFIYFQTTGLADGDHKVDIKVTTANETNPFILDYFRIVPSVETPRSTPSPTSGGGTSPTSALPIVPTQSFPVGAIVGGVVGGIAGIVILVLALLWCFLRKRSRGGQAYYFEKPTPADILAGEGP